MRPVVTLLTILLLPSLVCAHHSFSEFDQSRTIEISGTLSEVAWQNPHVRLKVQSEDAGNVVTWDIERTPQRMGCRRDVSHHSSRASRTRTPFELTTATA